MHKQYDENQTKNGYWLNQLESVIIDGHNFHDIYTKTLDSITPEDVQQYLSNLLTDPVYLEMVANGEPAAEETAETEAKPAA